MRYNLLSVISFNYEESLQLDRLIITDKDGRLSIRSQRRFKLAFNGSILIQNKHLRSKFQLFSEIFIDTVRHLTVWKRTNLF
jgi:hypothetical protein